MSIEIQQNIKLSEYTTFKIGGKAKYFCVAKDIEEIQEALKYAKENKLAIFILGGGSNLLISDQGFDGLVIKIQDAKYKIQTDKEIYVGVGVLLSKLVSESVKKNLTGLEWAAGIPGTIGGAICNNAGAHGRSMEDIVEKVEVIEIDCGDYKGWDVKKFSKQDCNLSYRNSIFKTEKKYIILNLVLKLRKGNETESRKIIIKYLESRKEKQSLEFPSAGSIFKNPEIDEKKFKELCDKYPNFPIIEAQPPYFVPVGWFVEELGLKEKKIGGAMISEKHGNFIINIGDAKAEDVVILISFIKQKVRDYFGVQLCEEIEYVGF